MQFLSTVFFSRACTKNKYFSSTHQTKKWRLLPSQTKHFRSWNRLADCTIALMGAPTNLRAIFSAPCFVQFCYGASLFHFNFSKNFRNVLPCVGEIGDTPLESEFFDIDPQRGVQVTLMAHEVVFIPFAFLSLEPRRPAPLTSTSRRRTRSAGRGGLEGDGRSGDNATGEGGAGMAERSVAVAFVSASHGHVVSVVQVGGSLQRVVEGSGQSHVENIHSCRWHAVELGVDNIFCS